MTEETLRPASPAPASPSDEEVAAIMAAVEVVWPRPAATGPPDTPTWRFSGRWWRGPVPAQRQRPESWYRT